MSQGETQHIERAREQALAWIARLRSDLASEKDRQAFALWLAEDERNREAMDSALDLWDDLAVVRHLPFNIEPANSANHWPRWAAAAACLVLALFVGTLVNTEQQEPVYFQTAVGERLSTGLEDGSRLTLNTNSRVRVSYDADQRLLELLRGEVFFQVASDAQRPFHVDTGSARVTAIGTAFNIRRTGQSAAITVTEGVVRVTEHGVTGNRAPASEVLHSNQQLQASSRGLHGSTTVDTGKELAWQQGELVAEQMRLPELVAELERYHDLHIIISDAEVAAMTVSGVFQLDQPRAILQALELSLDLQLVQLDERSIQLLKPAQ